MPIEQGCFSFAVFGTMLLFVSEFYNEQFSGNVTDETLFSKSPDQPLL